MAKLDKSVVLYFKPDEIGDPTGARCNICRHWVDSDKCTEVTGKISGPKGICGLFAFGEHMGPEKPPDISPKSAGYAETGPSHCGNCKFYGGGEEAEGPCQIVTGTVQYEGCCNGWIPGAAEKQMRENIKPKNEAGEGIKRPMKKEAREGNEEKLIAKLEDGIQDEKEAIDFYTNTLIPILDEPEEVSVVEGILADERRHLALVTQIKEEEEQEAEKARGKRRVDDPLNIEDESGAGSGVEKKKRKPGEPVNTEGEAGVEYSLEKSYDPEKKHKDATLGDMVEIAQARLPHIFRQAAEKYLGVPYNEIKIAKQGNPAYRSNLVRFAIQNAFTPDEIEREANFEPYGSEEPIPVVRLSVDTGTEKFSGLAEGYLFLRLEDGTKAILGMFPGMGGATSLEIFSTSKDTSADIINALNEYIRDNNYLRGKKLLSNGQFLNIGKTTWDDVILSDEMKHTLQTHVLGYIANIEELRKLGLPTKRGMLIVGPPGNGKTLIGKALAWNSPSTFIWVPSSSEYHNVFVMARELAPSIVFIEDIAAHGGLDRRAGPVDSNTAELLNTLDGVEQNDLILTVATENNVDLLDPALRNRPGRFDVIVPLPNPSVDLRERILRHYLPETDQDLIMYAANQTSGYSGAHLRELATRMILEKVTKDNIQEIIDGISNTFGAINDFEQDSEKELNEANVAGVFRERTIGDDKSRRYGPKRRKFPVGLNPPSDPGDPTGKSVGDEWYEAQGGASPIGVGGLTDPVRTTEVLRNRGKHPELPKKRKKEPPHTINPASSPPAVTVNIGSGVANLSDGPDPYNDLSLSDQEEMYEDFELGITLIHGDLNTILTGPHSLIKSSVTFNRYNNEQRVDIDLQEDGKRVCQFTFFVPDPAKLSPDQLGIAETLTAARYASEMQQPVDVEISNPYPEDLDKLLTEYAGVEIVFLGDKYRSVKEQPEITKQTILLSGGLDSAALFFSKKGEADSLTFYHGQPAFTHGQWTEKKAVKKLVDICQEIFDNDMSPLFANHRFRVLKKGKVWAKSFRNLFFAAHGAFLLPNSELLLGCHRDDIEHDCNNDLITQFRELTGIPIAMPNINASRPDILKSLVENTDKYHPYIYASTQSCQMSRFYGKEHLFCGSCHSCLLRLSGAQHELDPRFANFNPASEVVPEELNMSVAKAWRTKKFSWAPFNKWWGNLSEQQKEDFSSGVDLIKQLENGKIVVPIKKTLPKDFIVRFVGGNNHTLVKDLERYKATGETVFVPFTGSGREVYRFAQQGKSVICADTQYLSLCLVQGVLVGTGATDIDFDAPDFKKGISIDKKLFGTPETIAGYMDSYASMYSDNLFALAVLANSITNSFFWGYVADNAKFMVKTLAEFKEDLRSVYKRLLKYYGTCPTVDFHWGSYEDIKASSDLVFVDPPKVIGDSDIYSEKFEGLNSILAQKDITLPIWTSDGYLDRFQKIFDQSWKSLLFVYTSDVFPTVSELEERLGTLGEVKLVKTYKMGKRTDYLFSVEKPVKKSWW